MPRYYIKSNGKVVDTIVADQEFVEAQFPGAWELVPEPNTPSVSYVPPTVTRAQGKVALINAGLWDAAVAYVSSISDPVQRAYADVALNDTQEWRRDSQFLKQSCKAMKITDKQLDELFILASTVTL